MNKTLAFITLLCITTSAQTIEFEKYELANGLDVILHKDASDPIVAVATLVHVGSNREKPGKTGFAHFFEHMAFNDSENVPVGSNRKLIPEWGGERNGGTWSDGTIYYEVVPKDAFEKILWIDSDRLGYMINTVTESALEREKQVVKNEKRQRVDNAPYGFIDEIKRRYLYPSGHPYSWTVIGSLPDLQAATLTDVKEFYNEYYGPNNATLVIAGDIDIPRTKELVDLWFGEIKKGKNVTKPKVQTVQLQETKSLYFEDDFAKLPQLNIVYPTVEEYNKDIYALNILGNLLSDYKTSPFYQVIVQEKKLAPSISTYQSGNELAGEFTITIRANNGVDLNQVKQAIDESFRRFETQGVSESDLKQTKAELELSLYQGFSTVLNKAFSLASYNEFIGDPGYILKEAEYTKNVTKEDVLRVYNKYIKHKPFVMISNVPKGQLNLAIKNSKEATVYKEEIKQDVANEEVTQGEEAVYEKTITKHDRSEPPFSELPRFKSPDIKHVTKIDSDIYIIENNEVPLTSFSIRIPGGHFNDPKGKEGVANLMTQLMTEGTKSRTPEELEKEINLLGARISINTDTEDIYIKGTCLSRNLDKTLKLVEEIVFEPRWDIKEFERLKQAQLTQLKGREAQPTTIGFLNLRKLIYGDTPYGIPTSGIVETVNEISLDDLKKFYKDEFLNDLDVADFHFAGNTTKKEVVKLLNKTKILNYSYNSSDAIDALDKIRDKLNYPENKGKLFFIDFPDAKQSVILLGKLTKEGSNPELNNIEYASEILGGGSSGRLFQTLRIEKGYTYGAYSFFRKNKVNSLFTVYTNVRSNATKPSLDIIQNMIQDYPNSFGAEETSTTKNKLIKGSTLNFESLDEKLSILEEISKNNKPLNFLETDQQELIGITNNEFVQLIQENFKEEDFVYLIVGDKHTQFDLIKEFADNKEVIELDIFGNIK